MKNILVLGIGNIARMDDGIGVHVINYIRDSGLNIPDNVEIIDGGMALYDYFPMMMKRDKIVIVDALRFDDDPGSVYRFPSEHVKSSAGMSLFRSTDLKSVLQHIYIFSGKADVEIVGIVPEDTDSEKADLSPSVRGAVRAAAVEVLRAVNCI